MNTKKPEHIVCFALPAWEAEYLRSTVELMKELAANNLVLYVDYAYTISDCIKGMLGKKAFDWKRLLGFKDRLRKIEGTGDVGLYVLSLPPIFPSFRASSYRHFQWLNKINAAFTGYFINTAIKKLGMRNIIGFNSYQPFLGRFWKIDNITYKVYYIYDDFTDIPYFRGFASVEESRFIQENDLVIVTSDELKKRKQRMNIPVEVVNNGVHFQSFFQHIKINKLNGKYIKTVGYTGTMDSRIDIDLLESVIARMQETRFLFVGKVFDQNIYTRLIKYINVCFEPAVATERMPLVLSEINIGIIPYVCNNLTAAIHPLKVNEYLAMGLPVVMTPFASMGEADDVVYTARGPKSFIHCLELALLEDDEALQQKRIAIAREADWEKRAEQLLDIIIAYREKANVSTTHSQN